jgi:hypothetical protein
VASAPRQRYGLLISINARFHGSGIVAP